jgi:hypothetical protein
MVPLLRINAAMYVVLPPVQATCNRFLIELLRLFYCAVTTTKEEQAALMPTPWHDPRMLSKL